METQRKKKNPLKSKTLWFNALIAGVGALETAAPGTIPAGPAMVVISVVGAVLRSVTTAPVR
jgi:hypothetical protein